MTRRLLIVTPVLCAMLFSILPVAAEQPAAAAKDPNDPIERIKDEGMNRSQVTQTISYSLQRRDA